ncbi:DUF6788 family protein [Ktedonobacter racemifer]|uniref:Transcriptional activator domain protein n=1 Tax=Ktedonobacter racemifer DSM 44963 TaxID=485913 RepID=D6TZG3_KTERA|nr:DUF6788 family protein [Ktedonobacter racemifer]EFH81953.1 transcriptional activator domain protein [Ktedonobacter racemifer DSM 44963]
MNSKTTYHQQVSYCGKPRCRKCREGTGHGPYWYAYKTVDGRTTRTYIGKNLPPEIQAQLEGRSETSALAEASSQSQALVRIYVLGQFRLERRSPRSGEWQTVTESTWQHQRVRALLASLVCANGRKMGREQIIEMLWQDLDYETASNRLDRAVYSLRQLFEPQRSRPATSPLLLTEREVLVLGDQSQVWIDADAFEQLLTQANALIHSDPGQAEKRLNEAATLYGGSFLPEMRKMEWSGARRSSLQRSWIGMLLELADMRTQREAFQDAIIPLDRLLAVDPTNEAAVQRIMKLLVHLDRRGEALRAYKHLAQVLRQEYNIVPLPDTRQLYEDLKRGNKSVATEVRGSAIGVAEQIASAQATRTGGTETSPAIQIGRAHQSPLIGREKELAILREMVETTEHAARFKLTVQKKTIASTLDTPRRPQCGVLMGEVGIGKTRLAEELSREARGKSWAVAWSRVYAQEGSIPYRLWTEVLRKATTQGAWQRQELTRRPLVFQPLTALLPELTEFLPPVALTPPLPPEQEQLRLWEATRELLTLISESTPLIIALDDLQWADGSSCELLAYLARRIQGYPIVIVGTCRDNELPLNHPLKALLTDLQREHAVETVSLEPLETEQISTLVSYVSNISQPLAQSISKRADGNPFFAEELARGLGAQLATASASTGQNGNGHTTVRGTLGKVNANGEEPLPDTISAVLDLRLERLSDACRRLLQKAAVLGGSFQFQVICAMEANTPDMDEDLVLDLLEEGLTSGMLTEEGTGTRVTYQFWHPLLVSHLYDRLSAARRASLHRRAADVFQQMYGDHEEHAATITDHLVKGGAISSKIAHFAELAARFSYSLSAYPDAEKHYKIALENLDRTTQNQEHYAYLLECVGECTRFQGKFEEARSFYEQALEEHRKLNGYNAFSKEEAQIQALLLCEIGSNWYEVGNAQKAQQFYQLSEELLKKVDITAGHAWAYLWYWESRNSWREGNYNRAREVLLEAIHLFEDTTNRGNSGIGKLSYSTQIQRTLLGDPVILGRMYNLLGMIETASGRSSDGLNYYSKALTIFEQYDQARDIALLSCNMGDVHLRRAEFEQSQAALRRSLNLAERVGETQLISFARGNLGVLDARRGNLREAEADLEQSIADAESLNQTAIISIMQATLATVQQDLGKLSKARVALRQALKLSYSMQIPPYTGMSLVSLGNLRLRQYLESVMGEENHLTQSMFLKKARLTLEKALNIEGLEVETRIEGQLALAEVWLLMGEDVKADEQVEQASANIDKYELTWLQCLEQRILGNVKAHAANVVEAARSYDHALSASRKYGMRLEEAHTLLSYGQLLLKKHPDLANHEEQSYQRGMRYLQDALRIFKECGAELDARRAEKILEDL